MSENMKMKVNSSVKAGHRPARRMVSDFLRVPLRAPCRRVGLFGNDLVAANKNSRSKIMQNKISRFPALSLAVAAMLITLNAPLSTAFAQGAAFPIVTNNGDTGFGFASDGTNYMVGIQGDYVSPNNYSVTAIIAVGWLKEISDY